MTDKEKMDLITTIIYDFRYSHRKYMTSREQAVAQDVLIDSILAIIRSKPDNEDK